MEQHHGCRPSPRNRPRNLRNRGRLRPLDRTLTFRPRDGEDAMTVQFRSDVTAAERYHSFERVALVLQGGGALGAYQAGVYEALAEAGIHPDWIAGVSVGAINGAIIAGNPPKSRIDKLREFWTRVTADGYLPCFGGLARAAARGNIAR